MNRITPAHIVQTGLFAAAGFACLLLPAAPANARFQSGPAELRLTGVVRDFGATHPDFDVIPAGGLGHTAGNVALTLGPDGRPTFVGGGNRMAGQAYDAAGRAIPPHLAGAYTPPSQAACHIIPSLAADGMVDINNSSRVDGFDSRLGPYGGANVAPHGTVGTNSTAPNMLRNENSSFIDGHALFGPGGNPQQVYSTSPNSVRTGALNALPQPIPIPTVAMPTGLPPSTGDALLANGSVTLTGDMHVDTLELRSGAVVTVASDVTIVCDDDFIMNTKGGSGFARVIVQPGASLDLLVGGDISIVGELNYDGGNGDPGRCRIIKVGAGSIEILSNVSMVMARIIAPDADLTVRQSAEVFGTFVGASVTLDNNARFHIDTAFAQTFPAPPDTPCAPGNASDGGIASTATFDQWFRDVPGANQSTAHTITMTRDAYGVYEYATPDFHPIDDRLLGNQGGPRNDFFTYAIDARFTYEACAGHMVEFEGSDDAWLFIDGQLVMDLGGVLPGSSQFVDLDRLGLTEGQTYRFLFLYAQRQDSTADFALRTTLELTTATVPIVVSAAGD